MRYRILTRALERASLRIKVAQSLMHCDDGMIRLRASRAHGRTLPRYLRVLRALQDSR